MPDLVLDEETHWMGVEMKKTCNVLPPAHVERLVVLHPGDSDGHGGVRRHLAVQSSRGPSDRRLLLGGLNDADGL